MSTRFAPNTNFNSHKSSSIRTPTKGSPMTLSELSSSTANSQFKEEALECLSQIDETKSSLHMLMEKTKSYSKNSGSNYKDSLTPKSQKKTAYQKSPFGQKLHISDYSCFCTPTTTKSRKI